MGEPRDFGAHFKKPVTLKGRREKGEAAHQPKGVDEAAMMLAPGAYRRRIT